jgi:hypothetical protein
MKYDTLRYKRRNQIEGLAAWGDPIRQMSKGLPVGHRLGRSRHLLDMSPGPGG